MIMFYCKNLETGQKCIDVSKIISNFVMSQSKIPKRHFWDKNAYNFFIFQSAVIVKLSNVSWKHLQIDGIDIFKLESIPDFISWSLKHLTKGFGNVSTEHGSYTIRALLCSQISKQWAFKLC